jgi:hypothetical protein
MASIISNPNHSAQRPTEEDGPHPLLPLLRTTGTLELPVFKPSPQMSQRAPVCSPTRAPSLCRGLQLRGENCLQPTITPGVKEA